MIHTLLNLIDRVRGFRRVDAHCDIPCGIYDPIPAQIAALTVIRMVDLIEALEETDTTVSQQKLHRYIINKEEHAEKCKHEIRVIFGDYIKDKHLDEHPDLPQLFHRIMQQGSAARQSLDKKAATDLLDSVNAFAEIFWTTKGVQTKRAKAPYPPALDVVYPDLS